MPLFSVIIPAYNAEKWVLRALESVKRQTFDDYEIIATNDGSQDDTAELIRDWFNQNPAIPSKLIDQKNQGIAAARNAAIASSSGEFLAFLDADDDWLATKLASVVEYIEKNRDIDLVCHAENHIFQTDSGETRRRVVIYGPFTQYADLLFKGNSISTSSTVVRRQLVKGLGGFDQDMAINGVEDYDMWMRIAAQGAKIGYMEEVLGNYYIHVGGTTQGVQGIIKHLEHGLNLLDRHFARWQPKNSKYKTLLRRRKAMAFRRAGNSLLKRGQRKSALGFQAKAVWMDPLSIKNLISIMAGLVPGSSRFI